MKFLSRKLKQHGKAQVLASAESSLTTSAAVPDSGFDFVRNSQGASAAVAELARHLDGALDGVGVDGDLSDRLKLELGRLDKAASAYANSCLGEDFSQVPWNCSAQDAQLVSLAWKCTAATHDNAVITAPDDISVDVLKYIKPSMGGSVKAALVALVEQSSVSTSKNPHLPVLVIAVRGSKSTVDFMVNANSKSEDTGNLFDVNDLLTSKMPPRIIRAHTGFINCAIALVKYIDTIIMGSKASHVLFTGHSAGGAVASLLFLKYLAALKKTGSNQKISCITFGAPPVIQPNINQILQRNDPDALNIGINLAIANEYDLVSRADQPYIRSLVDLYRSLFQLGPVSDDSCTASETSSTLAGSSMDAAVIISKQKTKMWNLPEPAFWLVGEIVLLRIEAVEVEVDDEGEATPQTGGRMMMKRILRAFSVHQEEFVRLVFCRIAVHRSVEYEKRIGMLLEGTSG